MLCSVLTGLVIMIIHNGIASTHSSPAKEEGRKPGATIIASHAALRHSSSSSNPSADLSNDIKLSKRIKKNWQHQLVIELESVIIKLRNVIDKYELKQEELKSLYSGVTDCGRDKCGNFSHLLPKNKKLEQFKCRKFEKPRLLKKWTSRLLSSFQKGVGHFEKSFQLLISFEKSPEFRKQYRSNRSRLRILKDLRTHLKTLRIEILELVNVATNKRLIPPQPRTAPLKHPESQTHLMINEWLTIQHSKEFLDKYQKQIEKVFKCWKRKARKERIGVKDPPKEKNEENRIDRPREKGNYINERDKLYNKIYKKEMERREKNFLRRRKHLGNP